MDTIGVGLIGCGVMGTSLAQECVRLDHARLAAVSDVDREMAGKSGAALHVPWHTDYREMLRRDDVQAVLIAVPGFLHAELTAAAAEAGKHVFCEKPMSVTLEGCDAMLAACARNGRKLTVGQVCRYHAVHSRVRRMVAEGYIGDPTCMVVRRLGGGWSGVWKKDWRTMRAKSGGTLMEINAHEIDFMRWVCGDVRRVTAAGRHGREGRTDFQAIMLVTLEFTNGAVGLLHSSSVSAVGEYGGRIDGTEGSLRFPEIWGRGAGIHYARFEEGAASFLPASDIVVEEPVRAELRAFIEAIRQDVEPPVTGADGRAVVEIALAAYRSAETGRPVDLPLEG